MGLLPKTAADYKLGGCSHVHLPVHFDDGVKWLVRICRRITSDWRDRDADTESEMETMKVMHAAGLKVPQVYSEEMGKLANGCPYFFLEMIENAKPFDFRWANPSWTQAQIDAVINELADFQIQLSTISFPAIGCLYKSESGPIVGPLLRNGTKDLPESLRGPFKSFREAWSTRIEWHMSRAKTVVPYLRHLALRELIRHPVYDSTSTRFYIAHGEPKGDHFLASLPDGTLQSVIDWEFSKTRSFEDAFAAPRALLDFPAFSAGSNALSREEEQLAHAYESKGRRDLAACVREGRKYQRMIDCVEHTWGFSSRKLNALVEAVTGERFSFDESMEEWMVRMKQKFVDDEKLQELVTAAEKRSAAWNARKAENEMKS